MSLQKTVANYRGATTNVVAVLVLSLFLAGCALKVPGTLTSIEDIYGQWKSYSNLSYELRVLKHDGKDIGTEDQGVVKFYTKGTNRSRIEVVTKGEPSVMIFNGEKNLNILYYPANNQYIDAGFGQGSAGTLNLAQEIDDFYNEIKDKYKIVGRETLQDVSTLVLEGPGTDDNTQKVWVSSSTGLPLKLQTVDAQGSIMNDFEFANHTTSNLDDQLFEVPAGATEVSFDDFLKKLLPQTTGDDSSVDPQ